MPLLKELEVSEVKAMAFDGPDDSGHFGPYGGIFVGETLIAAVAKLKEVYKELSGREEFWRQFDKELKYKYQYSIVNMIHHHKKQLLLDLVLPS